MIVTCPNCSTRYQLDADVLAPNGRALRCVRCGHSWTQRPTAEPAARVVVEEPEDDDLDVPDFGIEAPTRPRRGRTPAAARRRERGRGGRSGRVRASRARRAAGGGNIGWIVLVGVVAVVVAGLFFLRAEVVSYFPAAKQAYDLAGISTAPRATAPGEGLRFLQDSIVLTTRDEDGMRVIAIEGDVQNVTRSTKPVPSIIAVILLDENREVLTEWRFRSPTDVLGPTDKFTFRTEVFDAPAAARNLEFRFVTEGQDEQ